MSAVLVSLPTARPSCADDSEERTQFFRPNQKRPTWKDVERARATAPVRQVPALQLVPRPDTRGSHRAPAATHVPPYLRPGYWKGEVKTGSELHAQIRRDMAKAATIRTFPKSIGALLNTPEWKGAVVTSEGEGDSAVMVLTHPSGAVMRLRPSAFQR